MPSKKRHNLFLQPKLQQMRLGQLARKYDIPVQDILGYLEEETGEKFHANAKLFDAIEEKLFQHFDLYPDNPVVVEEETEGEKVSDEIIADYEVSLDKSTKNEPESAADDIASVDGELELKPMEESGGQEDKTTKPEQSKPSHGDDEVIQTDRLLELLESEDMPADLDKIKLIKAPKKELSGLKVLGKVDLPEPKKKSKPAAEAKESDHSRNRKNKRQQLSEEEREKRRLKAKRKKEAFEARQKKRRKEQDAQRLKELREAHYKQNLQKSEIKKQNQKKKITSPPAQEKKKDTLPAPKTWLGKWWRWMNT